MIRLMSTFQPSARIAHFQQDVWSIFSPLAAHVNAVNLGQGFPNFKTPAFIKDAACSAIHADVNQYSPPKGLLRLRKALVNEYGPLMNQQLDPETNVIVTAGANEGMFSIFQAFLDEGSEVICFEPFFDQYAPNITMSGGVMKCCPLRPDLAAVDADGNLKSSQWKVDMQELEGMITDNTKMVVLNTPHNPVGKVFTRNELQQIAGIVIKHDLMIISDEVYERLVYDDDCEHVRIATLSQEMWDRTITVGSAGKSFCITGWRVGWLIGPQPLINRALIAHSRIVFCTNSPLQEGVAIGMEQVAQNGFFEQQLKDYTRKRDFMVKLFKDIGMPITVPDGSYFILANIEGLHVSDEELAESEPTEALFCLEGKVPERSRDWKICRWLTCKIGVAAIPPSEFYGKEHAHLAEGYARFSFCKTDETLQEAADKLQELRKYLKSKT